MAGSNLAVGITIKVKDEASKAVKKLAKMGGKLGKAFNKTLKGMRRGFKNIIKSGVKKLGKAFKNTIKDMRKSLKNIKFNIIVVNQSLDLLGKAWGAVTGIIGGAINATANIVSDAAQKNVKEDLAGSQIEVNKALEEGAQKTKWNKSSKMFDKAIKSGKVTTDLILPDAKGVTNYDKLATSRNIRFSNLQNQVGDTDTDVYDFLPYDFIGNTNNPGKYFEIEGASDLKDNQHLLNQFQGGKISIFPDSTKTNP